MSAADLCQKALTVLDADLPIQPGSAIHRMIRQHFDVKRSTVMTKRGEILEMLAKAGVGVRPLTIASHINRSPSFTKALLAELRDDGAIYRCLDGWRLTEQRS